MNMILKVIGLPKLLEFVWSKVHPELKKWAESDGEDDWDDRAVEIADGIVRMIIGKLEDKQ